MGLCSFVGPHKVPVTNQNLLLPKFSQGNCSVHWAKFQSMNEELLTGVWPFGWPQSNWPGWCSLNMDDGTRWGSGDFLPLPMAGHQSTNPAVRIIYKQAELNWRWQLFCSEEHQPRRAGGGSSKKWDLCPGGWKLGMNKVLGELCWGLHIGNECVVHGYHVHSIQLKVRWLKFRDGEWLAHSPNLGEHSCFLVPSPTSI